MTVGDPGNPNDPLTGAPTDYGPLPVRGAVPHVYGISKYETTIGQYTAFLNAVAKSGLTVCTTLFCQVATQSEG